MSRISTRDIEDFLADEIPRLADRDLFFQYLIARIEDDATRGDYLTNLVNFVKDALEMLEFANRLPRDPFSKIPDIAAFYSAATMKDDRHASDKLSGSEFREMEDLARTAEDYAINIDEFKNAMERGRGRDRGDRGSRYSSERRDESPGRYSRSNRDSGNRSSNRYRDDDRSRGSRSNRYEEERSSGRYSSVNRRSNRNEGPLRRNGPSAADEMLLSRREALQRQQAEQEQDYRDETPRNRREPEPERGFRTPDPQRVNTTKRYEQVEPEDLTRPSEWTRERQAQEARDARTGKLPSGDGPLTENEMRSGVYDLNDINVIMAVPVQKSKNDRVIGEPVYEVDAVRPEWVIDEFSGYRKLKYIPLTEEEKDTVRREIHKVPIINTDFGGVRMNPNNDMIRTALTRDRFALDAAKNVYDADKEVWDKTVEEIRAENVGKPEEEQKPLPEDIPDIQITTDQPIRLRDVVKGHGIDHVKVLANQRAALMVEGMGDKYRSHARSVQFRGETYKPLFVAKDAQTAQAMVDRLGMFKISDKFELVLIEKIHEALVSATDVVPVPVISAIRRHVVQTINNIFKYEMGTKLAIDNFDDVATLGDDLLALRGEEFTKLFSNVLGPKLINLQLVQAGSGIEGTDPEIDARTIYAVVRMDAIIVPLIARDLSLASSDDTKEVKVKDETYIIDKEATPRLHKMNLQMNMYVHDNLHVRKMLLLADNNIAEIREDGIGKRAGIIQLITEQE